MAQGRCHLLKKAAQVLAHTLTLGHTHSSSHGLTGAHTVTYVRFQEAVANRKKPPNSHWRIVTCL